MMRSPVTSKTIKPISLCQEYRVLVSSSHRLAAERSVIQNPSTRDATSSMAVSQWISRVITEYVCGIIYPLIGIKCNDLARLFRRLCLASCKAGRARLLCCNWGYWLGPNPWNWLFMRLLNSLLALKRRISQCIDDIDSFIRAHLRWMGNSFKAEWRQAHIIFLSRPYLDDCNWCQYISCLNTVTWINISN